MQIWVDADACPGEIKELLFRAAIRTQTKVTLVANRSMFTPQSEFIDSILVPDGMNLADRRIVELVSPGGFGHHSRHTIGSRCRRYRWAGSRSAR